MIYFSFLSNKMGSQKWLTDFPGVFFVRKLCPKAAAELPPALPSGGAGLHRPAAPEAAAPLGGARGCGGAVSLLFR